MTLQGLAVGPVLAISVAPSGAFLACYTEDGRVVVYSSDFTRTLSEFATQVRSSCPAVILTSWCSW